MILSFWWAFAVVVLLAVVEALWLCRLLTCRRPHVCHRPHAPIRLPAVEADRMPARAHRRGPRSPFSVRHAPAFLPAHTAVEKRAPDEVAA